MSIAKRILKKLAPIIIDAAIDAIEDRLSGKKKKSRKNDTVDFGLERTWAAGDPEESIDDFEKRIRAAVRREKIKEPTKVMGVTDEAPGNPNRKRFFPSEIEKAGNRFDALGVEVFSAPKDYKHDETLKNFGDHNDDWFSDETFKNHKGRLLPDKRHQVVAVIARTNVTFNDFGGKNFSEVEEEIFLKKKLSQMPIY